MRGVCGARGVRGVRGERASPASCLGTHLASSANYLGQTWLAQQVAWASLARCWGSARANPIDLVWARLRGGLTPNPIAGYPA